MTKPILVIACGNPSRGDDALGPLLLENIERQCDLSRVELLTDFQLQIEHALDLRDREQVLFVDAAVSGEDGFNFSELIPIRDNSYSTHAMSPSAVLQVYRSVIDGEPPPSFLLSIRGFSFELGESLSEPAADHLLEASHFVRQLLTCRSAEIWRQYAI